MGGIIISYSIAGTFKKTVALLLICAAALVVATFGGSFAKADSEVPVYDVYLKLDGFTGESVTKGYEKWIVVNDNVQFGMKNLISVGTVTSGSGAGKVSFDSLQFTKAPDSASVPLMLTLARGSSIKTASLVFVKGGATAKPLAFLTVDLGDVFINSYEFDGGVEKIGLSFISITMSYTSMNSSGALNPAIKGGWDLKANKQIS
ncbi:type VI secretion system tube protein Hcp [Cohnella sp. WQ 127256]|uniref:Hcp family type VI secretion system effector n=1 Tax=Cohnella sp. WQ 127256 TaxID=2938790 RepID=UPI0021194C7E|nr:type VI secretion system tube protein Hcp [Cohnella sp. WQ 127256]